MNDPFFCGNAAGDFTADHTVGKIIKTSELDPLNANTPPDGCRPGFEQVPDAPQITLANGLDDAGQNNVRFKGQSQFLKNN